MYYFFFSSRRRHTRSKRDWSSDVCSSDLVASLHYTFGNSNRAPVIKRREVEGHDKSVYAKFTHRTTRETHIRSYATRPERSEERRVGKEGGAKSTQGKCQDKRSSDDEHPT